MEICRDAGQHLKWESVSVKSFLNYTQNFISGYRLVSFSKIQKVRECEILAKVWISENPFILMMAI